MANLDPSKLRFLSGALRADKQGAMPYMELFKTALTQLGVVYPSSSGGSVSKAAMIAALQDTPISIHLPAVETYDNSREFVILASAIFRAASAWSYGQPILWDLLNGSDGHGSMWFESAVGDPGSSVGLKVSYPLVRKVYNVSVTPDESFSANGTICGPTVGLDNFLLNVSRPINFGITLQGDGAGNWTKTPSNNSSLFDVTTFNTGDGGTSFNVITSNIGYDYDTIGIVYQGPNRYTVGRVYSGLGAYNARFILYDAAGAPLNSNPTSSDRIVIVGGAVPMQAVDMKTFNATNTFIATNYNWWILGVFEVWMLATTESTTSTWVKWQLTYPSATTYKIYRDTDPLFGTQVLVHTGTEGKYNDTGLSTGTTYYYKLVAVVGGVDTYVSKYSCTTL